LFCIPLIRPFVPLLYVVSFLLLNLLLLFSCSTCYFVPFAWLVFFCPSCSTCCFDLLLYSSCLTYNSFCSIYYVPLVWHVVPLLLFDLFAQVSFCYTRDFDAPCSSCSTLLLCFSCFRLVPPFYFLQVWSVEAVQIRVLQKVKNILFNFCLLMNFFNYPFFGKWWLIVCLFF
jgi:hypothetical protein